jgi:hypothetical protein
MIRQLLFSASVTVLSAQSPGTFRNMRRFTATNIATSARLAQPELYLWDRSFVFIDRRLASGLPLLRSWEGFPNHLIEASTPYVWVVPLSGLKIATEQPEW